MIAYMAWQFSTTCQGPVKHRYRAQIQHSAGGAAPLCCKQTRYTYHSRRLEEAMPPHAVVFVLRGAPVQLLADASFCCSNGAFICPVPFASLSTAHATAAATSVNTSSSSNLDGNLMGVGTSGRPQLLWQLARGSTSEGSEDYGSSDGSSGSTSSSGYYSSDMDGDDLDTEEVECFSKARCSFCRKDILPNQATRRWWWPWGRSSSSSSKALRRRLNKAPGFIVCDGCQGCFHERCCEKRGISIDDDHHNWYHSPDCRQCRQQLKQCARQGPILVSPKDTLELLDCRGREAAGSPAAARLKEGLSGTLDVLLPLYGPGLADQLRGSNFAVLLRHQQQPVTAGLLDVYGQNMAVLDFVGSDMACQRRGHCSTLLGGLSRLLGPGLGVRSLVAVLDPEDKDMQRVWQQKFGFQVMPRRQRNQLAQDVPVVRFYQQAVLLTKPLPKQVPGTLEQLWESTAHTQPQQQKGTLGEPGSDSELELPVEPLQVGVGGAAAAGTAQSKQ